MIRVVRVETTQPELLISHLVALGATVPVTIGERTVMVDGRPYRQLQASLDLPPHDGVALHLIIAGGRVGLTVEEFREVIERKRAAGDAGGPS